MLHTETAVVMQADAQTIYRLAAAVERWPEILPHYRRVRILANHGDCRTVAMAASRDGIPVSWTAEQCCFPDEPRITFRHVRGVTTGMDVVWAFEPGAEGTRVVIRHDLALGWPLIGGLVARHIIGPLFIENIAGKTLRRIKQLAEAEVRHG